MPGFWISFVSPSWMNIRQLERRNNKHWPVMSKGNLPHISWAKFTAISFPVKTPHDLVFIDLGLPSKMVCWLVQWVFFFLDVYGCSEKLSTYLVSENVQVFTCRYSCTYINLPTGMLYTSHSHVFTHLWMSKGWSLVSSNTRCAGLRRRA